MGKHKSHRQDEIFIKFMREHQDLAKNFVKGDRTIAESLWAELAKQLNSEGPPQKDVSGWKKVFSDWKGNIRKKIAANKREIRATGGGPYNRQVISQIEEELAIICGMYTSVEGIPNTISFAVADDQVENSSHDVGDSQIEDIAEPIVINSTEEPTTSRKRKRSETMQECLKKEVTKEAASVASISNTMKQLIECTKESIKVQKENRDCLRKVYKSIDKLSDQLSEQNSLLAEQNRDRIKNYTALQEFAKIKNEIKKKALEIEELKLK